MYSCFSFRVVPGCRRRHLCVDGAVRGVCASWHVYFSVCTFQLLSPILSVKLKRKNNSNSNNYNDNKQEEWKKRSIWVLPLR